MEEVQTKLRELALRIKEAELKRWWLAEQMGVHKTTFRRWFSGDIDISREDLWLLETIIKDNE